MAFRWYHIATKSLTVPAILFPQGISDLLEATCTHFNVRVVPADSWDDLVDFNTCLIVH